LELALDGKVAVTMGATSGIGARSVEVPVEAGRIGAGWRFATVGDDSEGVLPAVQRGDGPSARCVEATGELAQARA
jgi:hypothetical protein